MIEKLEKPKSIRWGYDADSCLQRQKIITDTISKINEIIKVLNVIIVDTKYETFIDGSKKVEPVDKFAEQRKWIGKLCWFWDEDREDAFCDILGYIFENSKYPYVQTGHSEGYKCCEPVKPDDDIIYKGE